MPFVNHDRILRDCVVLVSKILVIVQIKVLAILLSVLDIIIIITIILKCLDVIKLI